MAATLLLCMASSKFTCRLPLQFAKDMGWGDPVAGVYFKVKHGDA
jgi:hypothetical protein